MRARRLVLLFARLPREESHRKPLVRGARERHVEALYHRVFRRTLAVARSSGAATRLVTTGDLPPALAFPGLEVTRQIGETFAERLERAVADAFADGWEQIVLVGGDTPTLDVGHLEAAFDSLGDASGRRAVLGPACDGGYYLLGLNALPASTFRDVPLGTPDTGRATAEALTRAGFVVATLSPLRDLDDEDDVRLLASRPGALRTLAALLLAPLFSLFVRERAARARLFSTTVWPRGPPAATPTFS